MSVGIKQVGTFPKRVQGETSQFNQKSSSDLNQIVDGGNMVDVVNKDLQRAFDKVSYNRLVSKIEPHGTKSGMAAPTGCLSDWRKRYIGVPTGFNQCFSSSILIICRHGGLLSEDRIQPKTSSVHFSP